MVTVPTVLARDTQMPKLSPLDSRANDSQDDDLDKHPDLPKPRLSMPIEYEHYKGNEGFHISPPRLSVPIDDEAFTQRSIEAPRRAASAQRGELFSRRSFGSARMSDHFTDIDQSREYAASEDATQDNINEPDLDYRFENQADADDSVELRSDVSWLVFVLDGD